jgi:hypothetical protein
MEYFCTKEEEEKMKKNGMLSSSFGTMCEFLEKAKELLRHHCTSRCMIPVRKKTKFGEVGEVVSKLERNVSNLIIDCCHLVLMLDNLILSKLNMMKMPKKNINETWDN